MKRQGYLLILLATLIFALLLRAASGYACQNPAKESKNKNAQSDEDDQKNILERTVRSALAPRQAQVFGRPYTYYFLPIAFYHFDTGLNLGFNTHWFSPKRDAFLYRLRLQVIASLRNNHKHNFVFEYPQLADSKFGFILRGEWERTLQTRYFGLGNNSVNDRELTASGNKNFIHKDFYVYTLKRPRLKLFLTYQISSDIVFGFGAGFQSADPQPRDNPGESFLAVDRPFGYLGGSGKHLAFKMNWDTRSNRVFPLGGFHTELSFEPNWAAVNVESQTPDGLQKQSQNVTFSRYTFSDSRFLQIKSNRLILANRIAFEAISGAAPYYEFGQFSGQRNTRAVGGSQSLRGFNSRRFQDKIKLITLTELRFNYRPINLMSESFGVIFIAFFDNGRVWQKWSDLAFNDVHSTFGFGIWLNWDNNLIIRLDVGHSKEETLFPFLRLNTAF